MIPIYEWRKNTWLFYFTDLGFFKQHRGYGNFIDSWLWTYWIGWLITLTKTPGEKKTYNQLHSINCLCIFSLCIHHQLWKDRILKGTDFMQNHLWVPLVFTLEFAILKLLLKHIIYYSFLSIGCFKTDWPIEKSNPTARWRHKVMDLHLFLCRPPDCWRSIRLQWLNFKLKEVSEKFYSLTTAICFDMLVS